MTNKTMNIGNASNNVDVKITGNLSVSTTVTASTFVGALSNAITIGSQTYDGSAPVTISAGDLGLFNAMHFVGAKDSTNPSGTYNDGDVIVVKSTKKEYVYSGGEWIELGDEGSYVLKTSIGNTLKTDSSTGLIDVNAGNTLTVNTSTGKIDVNTGDTLKVNSSTGVIDYELPVATSSTLGGIKAGNNITIASDGTLSIGGYLPLSGGTMTGDINFTNGTHSIVTATENSSSVTGIKTILDSNNVISLKIEDKGADGIFSGLYDEDASQWIIYSSNGKASTSLPLYGAVWNDYAEFRRCYDGEAGCCVVENGDDTMSLSTKRLQYGGIISDTFGFVIGDQKNGKPIAVSGRVLAYTDKDRKNFKPGDAVCSGPHGTVSKMTRKEIKEYPEKILGVVSAVPTYEFWGPKQIPVNGRVWIKVR